MKQMLDGCSKMCNMCVDIHALPKRVLCFNHNTSVGVRQTHCLGHGRRSDTALGIFNSRRYEEEDEISISTSFQIEMCFSLKTSS